MLDPKQTKMELEARLTELKARAQRIGAHQHHTDRDIPKNWDDRLPYVENDALVDSLDEHTRREITMLEAAIGRIDGGSWGECTRCGGEISEVRLKALPEATLCIRCADHLDHHHT